MILRGRLAALPSLAAAFAFAGCGGGGGGSKPAASTAGATSAISSASTSGSATTTASATGAATSAIAGPSSGTALPGSSTVGATATPSSSHGGSSSSSSSGSPFGGGSSGGSSGHSSSSGSGSSHSGSSHGHSSSSHSSHHHSGSSSSTGSSTGGGGSTGGSSTGGTGATASSHHSSHHGSSHHSSSHHGSSSSSAAGGATASSSGSASSSGTASSTTGGTVSSTSGATTSSSSSTASSSTGATASSGSSHHSSHHHGSSHHGSTGGSSSSGVASSSGGTGTSTTATSSGGIASTTSSSSHHAAHHGHHGHGHHTAASANVAFFAPTGTARKVEAGLVQALDGAKTSIDIAMYLFSSKPLADAVVSAKARGIAVRVIFDGGEAKKQARVSKDLAIESAGIHVKRVQTTGSAMKPKFHHKFAVIDGKQVITGSYNWTEGADENNYENAAILNDASIAAAYAKEFESLWTSGNGGVGSTNDVIFAPSGSAKLVEKKITAELNAARSEIVIAMFLFTSAELENVVKSAIQRGVKVSLLVDHHETTVKSDGRVVKDLKAAGANVREMHMPGFTEFHDKFCVIDGQIVMTGSFNWDPNQDRHGWDNLVVVRDAAFAHQYLQAFSQAWSSPNAK